ncbi:ABC transporter substrate-binding protein [Corynebacterium pacaense]|uniref:ABC transporter substrate-binding protein n=1 Tax=Corynebacterium pacaense TaxID=1816684 RepID=UPI001178BD62|nr:ABC transporter substrate-binding protein [Corynebacterium pacaense]
MNITPRAPLALLASAVLLTACGSSDSLDGGEPGSGAIVVGSQDYYSNEIIAEIYSQALESSDYDVRRDFRIGQREVYIGEVEQGNVDLFPEYSGPLLQYWKPDTTARLREDVHSELVAAAPEGLSILDDSPASDQDSYVVTRELAEQYSLRSVADLANIPGPITLGANSEAETRPNGPKGLKSVYGIDAGFTPIEDGGGPLTIKALKDGDIQFAIVYTADPTIAKNDLVVLDDPRGLFLASNLVPVASDALDAPARDIINRISAALTSEDLINLNARSVDDQSPASTIAGQWLEEKGLTRLP